jgi:pyrroloquinoline quinone biosynthesis protein D
MSILKLNRLFRLQWEEAQQSFVLLYPEGMVKLNGPAGEILKRCDGRFTEEELIADLEATFAQTGIAPEIHNFLGEARRRNWLEA